MNRKSTALILSLFLLAIITALYLVPGIAVATKPKSQEMLRPRISSSLITTAVSEINEDELKETSDEAELEEESVSETQVLVSEVVVINPQGEEIPADLEDIVYGAILTRPGQTTTRSQIQEDINSVFATGFFSNVEAIPEDTSLGVRITFFASPNPILSEVRVANSALQDQNLTLDYEGEQATIQEVIDRVFSPQYGTTLNLLDFQDAIEEINTVYQNNGYVLAQIVDAPPPENGVVTLVVAEGIIEDIEVAFLSEDGLDVDEEGNPITGRTRDFVITREFASQSGDVFNQSKIQSDLQQVFSLGIFDDVRVALAPGDDPRRVDVIVNVIEGGTRNTEVGLGLSSSDSVFITSSLSENNLFGQGQKISVEARIGISKTELIGSLNSPGSISGKPIIQDSQFRPLIYSAVNTFNQAISGFFNSSKQIEAIEASNRLLELAKAELQEPLEVFILNNLTILYARDGDLVSALNSSGDALNILKRVASPALELSFSLRQASLYRSLGKPGKALESYIRALDLVEKYENETEIEILIGQDFFSLFSDEWQIKESQRLYLDNEIQHLYSLIKLGILLDVASTYSVLGSYQSGLYTVNSPTLPKVSNQLSDRLSNFLNDQEAVLNLLEGGDDFLNSFNELGSQFQSVASVARESALSLISQITEIYQLQTLKFLFSDLNEEDSVYFYNQKLEDMSSSLKKQFNTFLYASILFFSSSDPENISIDESSNFAQLLTRLNDFLPAMFDSETQSWRQVGIEQALNDEVLNKALSSALVNLFKDSNGSFSFEQGSRLEENLFDDSSNEQIRLLLQNLVPLAKDFVPFIFASSEKESSEFYAERIELIQSALDAWPPNTPELEEIEWLKGFLLKFQGDTHYNFKNYQLAAASYNSAIFRLRQLNSFFSSLLNPLEPNNSSESSSSSLLESWVPTIDGILKTQLLDTYLKSADANLELQNLQVAYEHYTLALKLSEEISPSSGFFGSLLYQQPEKADIYYGIARVETMRGNIDAAQQAIEASISVNEEFFPSQTLSGGLGIFNSAFVYGYGIPYQGLVNGSFKFESKNPWLAFNAEDSPPVERQCSTVTRYFACKQKYFNFYISLLLQKHQSNPSAGFDVQALEVSEQARVFNFSRPERSGQFTQPFAPAQSFEEIQAAISSDDDTLVLEFFLGEDQSYLWLFAKDGNLQTYQLPSRSVIEEKAQEFYNLLTSPPGRVRPKATTRAGQELSEMLLGQVADQLGTKRLVIIADGFLQYLPFNVLPNLAPDNFPTEEALKGEYAPVLNPLLLDHEIVHLPSASTLVALRHNAVNRLEPTRELAFFANPVFNHKDNRVQQLKLFDWSEPFTETDLENVEALYSSIPETERELERVLASNLIPDDQIQKFFGYEADLDTALSSELGQFRIVHFASHGIFNSNAPERSGIVLSGIDENGVVQPGLLSPTYAFEDMDLSATELVVLSGCRTGLSQGQIGREGITSLTSGLFDAGAERIVASLWSVRDDATRELMNRFYERMLDPENPMRPAEALTEAQRSMWNEPRWQTPYNWAAFNIQGEWQ